MDIRDVKAPTVTREAAAHHRSSAPAGTEHGWEQPVADGVTVAAGRLDTVGGDGAVIPASSTATPVATAAPLDDLLPDLIALRRDYPDLKLFLREETTGTACEGLHNGRTDCVLLALPYACGEVTAAPLFDDRLFVAFPDAELPNPPAVIAAADIDEDRLLLGSNALWESNRWSLLAGFVEAGESFESAVLREVEEESGVIVSDPVYLGSQPWPFPASVMVGMEARAVPGGTQLRPDGEEILAVRWFSREEIWRERDDILLPGGSSIAHAIVRDWYGGPLDEPPVPRSDAA